MLISFGLNTFQVFFLKKPETCHNLFVSLETMDIDEEQDDDDVEMNINANVASYDKNIYQPPPIISPLIKRNISPPLQPILSNQTNLHKWKHVKKIKR